MRSPVFAGAPETWPTGIDMRTPPAPGLAVPDVPPAAEPAWRCAPEQARSTLPGPTPAAVRPFAPGSGSSAGGPAFPPPVVPLSVLDLVRRISISPRPKRWPGPRPSRAASTAGLPPLLGRRAPQHAGHRQLGARGAHRAHRRGDRRRIRVGSGGRDAAQPRAAGRRRAVRHARGAAPGPHRPRHRPRAGHRPAHRARAAPQRGALGADDFPEQLGELLALLRAATDPRSSRACPATGHRPAIWLLGSSGYSAQVAGDARPAVRVRAPLQRAEHAARARALPRVFRPSAVARRAVRDGRRLRGRAPTPTRRRSGWRCPAPLPFLQLRTGRPGPVPTPEEAAAHPLHAGERAFIDGRMSSRSSAARHRTRRGSPSLLERHRADELMISRACTSRPTGIRSYELVHEALVPAPVLGPLRNIGTETSPEPGWNRITPGNLPRAPERSGLSPQRSGGAEARTTAPRVRSRTPRPRGAAPGGRPAAPHRGQGDHRPRCARRRPEW